MVPVCVANRDLLRDFSLPPPPTTTPTSQDLGRSSFRLCALFVPRKINRINHLNVCVKSRRLLGLLDRRSKAHIRIVRVNRPRD
jgi:hypothetical protein